MKYNFTILVFFINLFFAQILFGNINTKIVVKVENEIITNYDIKDKIKTTLLLSGRVINQQNIDNLKKNILDQLIFLRLKKIELSKFKIQKDPKRIDSYLRSISGNDLEGLKNKFLENDLDFEMFLEETDIEIRWQKLIYSIYEKKININNETIDNEVKKIINEKTYVEEFELSEIEIILDSENSPEKIIKDIEQKINTDGFENVAINFSYSTTATQKGYLGWISGNSLSNEIYQILLKTNIGNVTEPVVKQNTILFLKLNNKRKIEAKKIDTNELKNKIIEKKKTDIFNLYSQSRLSKLKNNSYIQY